jgi:hypothetical protein
MTELKARGGAALPKRCGSEECCSAEHIFAGNHACKNWPDFSFSRFAMNTTAPVEQKVSAKPIRVGFTCWRWETQRPKALVKLAQRLGVNVKVVQRNHFLQSDVEAVVSGQNVDRFIGEFARLS